MDYRHEIKYRITPGDAASIRTNLSAVAKLDPHAKEKGFYQIHSLYFDDPADTNAAPEAAGEGAQAQTSAESAERPGMPGDIGGGGPGGEFPGGEFPGGAFSGADSLIGGYRSEIWI